ncbi:hypothetical protein [Porcincola intestinalis]|uniref:hypothetical protein n=1 Tax=Porcincola intestinalis TaxID=2606632 RepID=UPI0038CD9CFC
MDLYDASAKRHDGVVDGRQVQIKVMQRDDIMISAEPYHSTALAMKGGADPDWLPGILLPTTLL